MNGIATDWASGTTRDWTGEVSIEYAQLAASEMLYYANSTAESTNQYNNPLTRCHIAQTS